MRAYKQTVDSLYLLTLFTVTLALLLSLDVRGDERAALVNAATRAGIETHLVQGMIMVESGGNPRAVGKAGEVGLLQMHPKYHPEPLNVRKIIEYLVEVKSICEPVLGDAWIVCWNYGPRRALQLDKPRETSYYKKVMREAKAHDVATTRSYSSNKRQVRLQSDNKETCKLAKN